MNFVHNSNIHHAWLDHLLMHWLPWERWISATLMPPIRASPSRPRHVIPLHAGIPSKEVSCHQDVYDLS